MSEGKAVWLDYEFTVYNPEVTDWHEVGGLYIFAGLGSDPQGNLEWHAYYIGATQDFSDRLPTHENWPAAAQLGATRIHAMTVQDAQPRAELELELVQKYQPPLNLQLKG